MTVNFKVSWECNCGKSFESLVGFDAHVSGCAVVNPEPEESEPVCRNCEAYFECEHVPCAVKVQSV